MGSYSSIMRAAILLAVVAVATGAPKFSKQAISTPLSRGGGRIVGGTEASPGEFPHQENSISLPSDGKEYSAGTMCTVSGWGTTSEGGSLGSALMKVTVPVVSDDDCRAAYGQSDVADSMICAGLDEGGKDSCQ